MSMEVNHPGVSILGPVGWPSVLGARFFLCVAAHPQALSSAPGPSRREGRPSSQGGETLPLSQLISARQPSARTWSCGHVATPPCRQG